jgi:hypothetical protein
MINQIMLDILIRKVQNGEIQIDSIKSEEYKAEVTRIISETQ